MFWRTCCTRQGVQSVFLSSKWQWKIRSAAHFRRGAEAGLHVPKVPMTAEVAQCSKFRRDAEGGLHVPKVPMTVEVTQCSSFRRVAEAGLHVTKGADHS